jgi:hypothetical protein
MSKNPLTPIDPAKLAEKIKNILDVADIRRKLFAEEVVGISLNALQTTLNRPKSCTFKKWEDCTSEMKRRFRIMHEWSKAYLSKKKMSDDEIIDTIELCDSIKKILIENKIPRWLFAKEVLGIEQGQLRSFINKPRPWAMCQDFKKEVYQKLHKWIQSPAESISSLKAISDSRKLTDCVEGEEVIDTLELVYKANKLLKKEGISKAQFSRMLDISLKEIENLIRFPAPWAVLTQLKKEEYHKIHEWLVENEDEEEVLQNSISEGVEDEEMDTFKVSRDIVQLLKAHGISHTFFAAKTLRTSAALFGELVTNTKPWTDLHKSQRDIFKIIEKWTLSKSEEIKGLEQKYQVYRAKCAISAQKSIRKRKAFD